MQWGMEWVWDPYKNSYKNIIAIINYKTEKFTKEIKFFI